jgi:type I restriction enzyme R subunit
VDEDRLRRERAVDHVAAVAERQGVGDAAERAALEQRLRRLECVDLALIVSPGQNEIEEMKDLGLDIVPHRKRMAESQPPLDERFKDPADPLSLVFACAMWLTGFDVLPRHVVDAGQRAPAPRP